jgi:peroxiredoxin
MSTLGLLSIFLNAGLAHAPAVDEPVTFRLQDFRGAWHASEDVKDRKAVVLAFVGAECPLAAQYTPRLAELSRAYDPKGVAFFAIDSNQQDAPSALARFAKKHDLPFPLLKDVGNALADRLAVERTPEVVVLDAQRVVRYRGRVDDQFGFGVHRPAPTTRDLALALDDLLANRPVATPRTEAAGCLIGRVRTPTGKSTITYSKEVARVLRDRCVACHRPGEIAPFSLATYKQAAGWAEMIAEVVRDGRMPPWHAARDHGRFANDARLTDSEKQTLLAWVDAGAPEGDARDLPEPARYPEGWRIPAPDLIVPLPRTVTVPATGTLPYHDFIIDPKFDHDVWVKASQARPGNPSVVHHLVVFVIEPGGDERSNKIDFLVAYAPGMPPQMFPEGMAKLVPAGSKLKVQLHYTPRGIPQEDRSEIGLCFADPTTVRKRMTAVSAINYELRIPAGDADYAATAEHRFDQDMVIHSLLPHMHMRGKAFRFEARYPGGQTEVLLDVPRYEFDWQNVYVLAEPKLMPEGTTLRCLARYDNSAENFSNPDPTRTVTWGEQTWDEMLVGYVDAALADQDLAQGEPLVRPRDDGQFDVTFRYRLRAGDRADAVYLAGAFNDWKPDALRLDGPDAEGRFTKTIALPAGTHEYKFVLDGTRWRQDPGNRREVGFYHNSAIELAKAK